ncbi:MAG: deoxyribose-phosphate aldolase [Desertimonas sp.]
MTPERARQAIGLLDLTDLADDATERAAAALCDRAAAAGVAAVCVWPRFVALAAGRLTDVGVRVATVVNFPSGSEPVDMVVSTTRAGRDAGADEIDVVLPYRALWGGDEAHATAVLDRVRDATGQGVLKVIIESGEQPDQTAVHTAAMFALDHGADFVKTSTGKTTISATLDAAGTILGVIAAADRRVGLKVSGGIRTAADAAAYLDLAEQTMGEHWVSPATFRFGASGLLDALVAAARHD